MKKLLPFLTLAVIIALAVSACASSATTSSTPTGTGTTTLPATTTGGSGSGSTGSTSSGSTGSTSSGSTGSTSSGGNGALIVYSTDAPASQNVTSIMVTIASVEVHVADASGNTTIPTTGNETTPTMTSVNGTGGGSGAGGQWINIPLNGNTTLDLLRLKGITAYLGSANLTPGTYTQIRLDISSVQVALNGGALQDATLPSGVLKVVRPFQISSNMVTSLTLDFVADQMVTVTGNGNIIVKPVVKLSVSNPLPKGQVGVTPSPTSSGNGPGPAGPTQSHSGNATAPNVGQTMIPVTPTTPTHK